MKTYIETTSKVLLDNLNLCDTEERKLKVIRLFLLEVTKKQRHACTEAIVERQAKEEYTLACFNADIA